MGKPISWSRYGAAALVGGALGRQYYHAGRDLYRGGRWIYNRARDAYDMASRFAKRKRTSGNRFNNKRRKFSKGRRGRGRLSVSAQAGNLSSAGFRRNRIRPRTLRKFLWRDTIYKNHFRSAADRSTSITTPPPAGLPLVPQLDTVRFNFVSVLPDNATAPFTPFWTTGGGAISSDTGVAVPLFNGDIVIRGGMARATFNNNGTSDAVRLRLFMVRSIYNPNFSVLPAANSIFGPTSWDPSLLPDFVKFGRVLRSWEFLMLPGQRPITVKFPLKTRKIDQDIHNSARGQRFFWMFHVSNCSDVDTAANTVTTHFSHNLSFVGDAIGTT